VTTSGDPWTLIGTVARTTTHRIAAFLRRAPVAPDGDAVVTSTVSGLILCRESAFRGVDPSEPLDVAAVLASGARAATYSAPGLIPVSPGAMAVWCFGKPDDNSIGSNSQGTLAYSEDTTTGTDGNIALVYELQTDIANIGPCQMTEGANGTDNWTSITFALRPAPDPPVDPSFPVFDGDAELGVDLAFGAGPFTPHPTWYDETVRRAGPRLPVVQAPERDPPLRQRLRGRPVVRPARPPGPGAGPATPGRRHEDRCHRLRPPVPPGS
jgi:hypothetical protein